MSLDAMKKVADAEAAARQSLHEATASAKAMIAEAEHAGRNAYEQRMAEAEAQARQMMLAAEETAAKNAEEITHHAENQCAVLRAHAEGRLNEASGLIVERIVMG